MTPRQKKVFDFIQSYISDRGFAPTYKEIMQATDIGYKSQCFGLLKNLEQQGKITIAKAKARGISICKGTVREKEQIKRLQKQLAIAVEALEDYAESDNWELENEKYIYWAKKGQPYPWRLAGKALKEIKGVNK